MATASATTAQLPGSLPRSKGHGARLLGPYSDRRLVARVRAGDEAAFERLFARYLPGLLSFCRHMLGSTQEAEDAVQHVFADAHRALLADDREIHLRAWLYAIARNRCLSMLRARREELALDEVDAARVSTTGLAAEVERREDLRELLADVSRLPEDQRAALVLAELGAHTHEEIAEVLGVRREKVKALVFQAREALAAARQARAIPCEEIREDLATLRGSALRRARIRRHLDACAGCRAFREEVGRQHAAFALLLPVVPSAALKASVGGGAAAAGASTLVFGAKGATKLLSTLALTGVAGGGGLVAVNELHERPAKASEEPRAARHASPSSPVAGAAAPATTAGTTIGARAPAVSRAQATAPRRGAAPSRTAPATAGRTPAAVRPHPTAAAPGAPAAGHRPMHLPPALGLPAPAHGAPPSAAPHRPAGVPGPPAELPPTSQAPAEPPGLANAGPPAALPPQAAGQPGGPSTAAQGPPADRPAQAPAATSRPTAPGPQAPQARPESSAPATAATPATPASPAGRGPATPATPATPAAAAPAEQAPAPGGGPPADPGTAGANGNGNGLAHAPGQAKRD